MNIQLSQNQQRVIGCLIEKSLTTPDQYPLSLNALTNACNQKSNREPVLSLSENDVQETIDVLRSKQLVMSQSGNTSRVEKYKHRFCNTEFGELQLSSQELAIVCVLFLRGSQTPGELRTRTNRLCEFQNVHETESVLTEMKNAEPKPFVIRLERKAGKRDSRYAHCFSDLMELEQASEADNSDELAAINVKPPTDVNQNSRIISLEEQVELMQLEIDELRQMIESIRA